MAQSGQSDRTRLCPLLEADIDHPAPGGIKKNVGDQYCGSPPWFNFAKHEKKIRENKTANVRFWAIGTTLDFGPGRFVRF
jgi:hypothetical protein